ncbi:MAG: ABC transporter permease subunit [Pseudomonadota bacterium]|nr:ABC transporter permease subunit [Pseudomonadota bacterium]
MTVAAEDRPAVADPETARGSGRAARLWSGPAIAAHAFTLMAVAAWWGYAQVVPPYQLPGPDVVARRMADFVTTPRLALQLAVSLGHVAAAMTIAFVIGTALAVAAYLAPALRLLVDGRLTPFLNAFSGIGWLFLGILWFGINSVTVVFAVTLVLMPFAIINVRAGLAELDAELIELGRSLTRSLPRRLAKLVLPQLMPYLFATLRTSFGVAWKVVLTAELFGGNAGVGYLLNVARQEFDTETIFAVILFILLFVALAESLAFRPAQRRLDRRYGRG